MQLDQLSWFPGHMTKTRRMITAEITNMDAVCEIIDARIPMSSRNPDIRAMAANKSRIVAWIRQTARRLSAGQHTSARWAMR